MTIEDKISKILNLSINNLWLGDNVEEVVIDPTTGPEDDSLTLTMRTMSITFETLYKNLASYPHSIDFSSDSKIVKTYYLENDKKINITTLIEQDGTLLKTTITGDTELPYPLLRTKTIYGDNVNVIYQEVK